MRSQIHNINIWSASTCRVHACMFTATGWFSLLVPQHLSCATSRSNLHWDEGTAHPALTRHSRRQPFCRVFRPGTGCFLLALAWLSKRNAVERLALGEPTENTVPNRVLPGKSIQHEPKPVSFEHVRAVCGELLGLATSPFQFCAHCVLQKMGRLKTHGVT